MSCHLLEHKHLSVTACDRFFKLGGLSEATLPWLSVSKWVYLEKAERNPVVMKASESRGCNIRSRSLTGIMVEWLLFSVASQGSEGKTKSHRNKNNFFSF